MDNKTLNVLSICGLLLIAIGIITPMVTMNISNDTFRYIYAAGALMLLAGRILYRSDGDNTRLKRLHRLETWSALFFVVGAVFMFYETTSLRDPLAFTVGGAVIQIYTSIMIPRAEQKNN